MVTIEVNGDKMEATPGETILSALGRAGISVPTLCHVEGLSPTGACRVCVVEVDGMPGLVPSCSYPVAEGMRIKTHSSRALEARRTIMQLLLANHPDDCLYCVRGGDCELQQLSRELGVDQRLYRGQRSHHEADVSGPSIIRDPDKCILCGKCIRICEEVQGVAAIDFLRRGSRTFVGTAFDRGLANSACVNCGQCINVCPTGALREYSYIDEVEAALRDPQRMVVVQHAPAVSVSLAEEFGMKPGTDVDGVMVAALRRIGCDRVFDTSFTADLTIMEEASELAHRVANGGVLPMFTSCSPGWISFLEEFYPEYIPNLSSCKSPQQMMGALVKSFYAERMGIEPSAITSVSIMPCTAKKYEAKREEMGRDFLPDVDYVLTTRELGRLIRRHGVDLHALKPEGADTPFGERTGAGKIFGASGGVMEAAVRTAHWMLTGKDMKDPVVWPLRGLDGAKTLHVKIGDLEVGAAVVNGLGNARKLLDELKAGKHPDLHFIEFMCCPGGCIGGGGQPLGTDRARLTARMQSLYQIDSDESKRASHYNAQVQRLYDEYLGKPLGEKSHKLLHTKYHRREILL